MKPLVHLITFQLKIILLIKSTYGLKYIDLSYPINNETVFLPQHKKYERLVDVEGYTEPGQIWFATYSLSTSEHTSTHIDAPYHSAESGWKLDEIPTSNLIAVPGLMINVTHKVTMPERINFNYAVTKLDLIEWEKENGVIGERSVVLINTGWGDRWPNENEVIGTDRNGVYNFPGIDLSAAKFLSTERNVVGIGIDTPSIDPGFSKLQMSHGHLGSRNVYIIENVGNLHLLPSKGFNLWVMPMKIDEGTGAPIRLVATVP